MKGFRNTGRARNEKEVLPEATIGDFKLEEDFLTGKITIMMKWEERSIHKCL